MLKEEGNRNIGISNGTIIRVILFGLLVYALYLLRSIVLIVLTSVVIASFSDAAVKRFKRIGIGRVFAVVIVYSCTVILLAGLFYLFIPVLVKETSNIVVLLSNYFPNFEQSSLDQVTGATDVVKNLSSTSSVTDLATTAQTFIKNVSAGFFSTIASVFGGIVNLLLIGVVSFYLSIQEDGVAKFLRIITPARNEEYVIGLWERTQNKIALWLKGQLILGLIVGILTYILLSILGIPYTFILSLAAAVFELVPFGITLAMVPAAAIAYLEGGITTALLVIGSYFVVQQIEGYVFQPLVIKKIVGISPLVVILSVLIGFQLAGFWGFILAIPVAVALLEYVDERERKKVAFENVQT